MYFLNTCKETLKASEQFSSDFPIISLYFACLLDVIASTTTAATLSLKIWIDHRPASKSVNMTNIPGSSRTVVFALRTKVLAKTILEHYSQTTFTKTVRILRIGLGKMWWPWLTEKTSIHLVNASSGQEPYRIFESDALLANQVSRLLHRILEKKMK